MTERIEAKRAVTTETRQTTPQTTITQTPVGEQPQPPLGLIIAVVGVIAVVVAVLILRRR